MVNRNFIIILLLVTTAAAGQSMYVSDELVITLRTGPSTDNAIVVNLRSGDPVQVLESDSETGYSRVRLNDGTEGWVLARFLSQQTIARDRLAVSEGALLEARERIGELEQELATVSAGLQSTTQRLGDAESANSSMNSELVDIRNASANALTVRDQNDSLRRGINDRDQELERLRFENRALGEAGTREWFVVGAGVLLGGIVIGLILPSLRRKQRSDW